MHANVSIFTHTPLYIIIHAYTITYIYINTHIHNTHSTPNIKENKLRGGEPERVSECVRGKEGLTPRGKKPAGAVLALRAVAKRRHTRVLATAEQSDAPAMEEDAAVMGMKV